MVRIPRGALTLQRKSLILKVLAEARSAIVLTRIPNNSNASSPLARLSLPFGDIFFVHSPRWLCGVEELWEYQWQQFSLFSLAHN